MRALIVDDHPLIQEAVRNVLGAIEPGAEIAMAADCDRGLEIASAGVPPDLVLLDLNLPGLAGIPAVKLWRSRFPDVPVVVLSALDDSQTVLGAIAAGAAGYIPKSSSNQVMQHAVRLVLAGGKYLPPELLTQTTLRPSMQAKRGALPPSTLELTERQMAVLKLIAGGAPNKIICRELGLAERTVKAHVTAILRALNVSSRTQAAVEAVKLGLAERK